MSHPYEIRADELRVGDTYRVDGEIFTVQAMAIPLRSDELTLWDGDGTELPSLRKSDRVFLLGRTS